MARTGELFQIEQTGYVSPIAEASIWLSGNDRYISFGSTAGASGYGIRDNAGVMEFKNLLGVWTPMGSGGGGSPGGSNTQLQRNAAGSFGGISGATSDGTAVTFATDALIAATLKAASSGGFLIEASNGTDIGILGAGNTANVEWYGSHNFDTATQDTIAAFTGAGKTLGSLSTATYPSLTELSYVKGVTSAIQTQLNAKVDDGAVTTSGLTMSTARILGRTTASTGAIEELSTVDSFVSAASDTTAGKIEIGTTAETNTGTDGTRAVSPDGLAGSYAGTKSVSIAVFAPTTDVSTGDGKAYITIPEALNGMDLIRAQATVVTAGTTNATTVMIHNVTDAVDMLSGAISIASGGTVGTVGTINTSNDGVATNDILRVDVDSVSTTAPKGLMVILEFRLA